MTGNEYQRAAARTMNPALTRDGQIMHSLLGMSSEVGELQGIWQKLYQGHVRDYAHEKKELGDVLWMIAEYCTATGWELEDVMQMNIDKLKARYPSGFTTENSLHRASGDI